MKIQEKMKWVYIISGFLLLGVSIFSGLWIQSAQLTGIYILGGIALILIGNLDNFTEFKAGIQGIYAKTREIIKEAEITLAELQSLALTVTKVTLSLVKRSGRMGGYDDAEEEKIKNDMIKILKEIKMPASKYSDVLQDWHLLTKFDYVLAILGNSTIPTGFEEKNIMDEWKALLSLEDIPTSDKLREFLRKWGGVSSPQIARNG